MARTENAVIFVYILHEDMKRIDPEFTTETRRKMTDSAESMLQEMVEDHYGDEVVFEDGKLKYYGWRDLSAYGLHGQGRVITWASPRTTSRFLLTPAGRDSIIREALKRKADRVSVVEMEEK